MTDHSTLKDSTPRHDDSAEFPFQLEITRGRTQNPMRPITHERFLIGAGERCDLRLGGNDMPPLHSIVHVDGIDVWIDVIADGPELKVNSESTRSANLADGDEIEIGTFQLALRDTGADSPPPILQAFNTDSIDGEPEIDPSTLSPAELIELIEQEEELIEEFEARKRMGLETLMQNLRDSQQDTTTQAIPPHVASRPAKERPQDLLIELESAISSLTRFAEELEQRASKLSHRDFQRTAATLLDFQQQIIGRLDAVLAKVSDNRKPKPVPHQHHRDVA
ncbi:MAG: FHA domain-containing protein [Planctomycetota bacterium]|jgi:hypothetical protein